MCSTYEGGTRHIPGRTQHMHCQTNGKLPNRSNKNTLAHTQARTHTCRHVHAQTDACPEMCLPKGLSDACPPLMRRHHVFIRFKCVFDVMGIAHLMQTSYAFSSSIGFYHSGVMVGATTGVSQENNKCKNSLNPKIVLGLLQIIKSGMLICNQGIGQNQQTSESVCKCFK